MKIDFNTIIKTLARIVFGSIAVLVCGVLIIYVIMFVVDWIKIVLI